MERWLRDIENFLVASDRFEEEIDGRNFDLIRKALERMKPVVIKPEKTDEYHPDGYVFLVRCPCCNSEINYIGYRLQETAVKHCGNCGKKMIIKFQALDLSE